MKRAVKLQRREMKREIKRLKREIQSLQMCDFARPERKDLTVIACAKILPSFMVHEQTIELAKNDLAIDLGKYILKTGLCAMYESDGPLGHEIRMQCTVVK